MTSGFMDPILIFILPPGGFFVFGLLVALSSKLSGKQKTAEDISCAKCPMNKNCSKLKEEGQCNG